MSAFPKERERQKELPSIVDFEMAARGPQIRRSPQTYVKTQTTLERVLGPGRESVSIGLWPSGERPAEKNPRRAKLPTGAIVFDYPTQLNATIQPGQIGDLFISHHDPDHIGPASHYPEKKLNPDLFRFQTHMYWQTKLMLDYLDKPPVFENITYFEPYRPITLPGIGIVIPIPFSHTSLDMFGFWIETTAGETILIVPDQGDGGRTNRALEYISKKAGSDGIDFLVADATNLGRRTMTIEEHLESVKRALRTTEHQPAKTAAVYVRPGNYGLIMLWQKEKMLDNFEVFFAPKLAKLLTDDLHWDEKYGEKLHFKIQALENPKGQISPDRPALIFWDKENPLDDKNHGVEQYHLIDTSRKLFHCRSGRITGASFVGLTGHSPTAVRDLLRVAKPAHHAVSHPPIDGKNFGFQHDQRKLQRRGDKWEFPRKAEGEEKW